MLSKSRMQSMTGELFQLLVNNREEALKKIKGANNNVKEMLNHFLAGKEDCYSYAKHMDGQRKYR